MKLHKLNCPNCGGILEIQLNHNVDKIFCPYCGQHFLLDDGNSTHTINKNERKNIKVEKDINYVHHIIDEAEIQKGKNSIKESKYILLFVAVMFALLFIGGSISDFQLEREQHQAQINGLISAGYYGDYEGEKYEVVIAQFEAMGFENIDTLDLNDAGVSFWKKDTVNSVSIGGDSKFDSSDYFEPNETVLITYH